MTVQNLGYKAENCDKGPSGKEDYDKSAGGWRRGWGITVPSAEAGWAPGAIFQHTDGSAGTHLYVNEGSATSCTFKAVDAGDINRLDETCIYWGDDDDIKMFLDPTVDALRIDYNAGDTNTIWFGFGGGTTTVLAASSSYGGRRLIMDSTDLRCALDGLSLEGLNKYRFHLKWLAGEHGLPGINADADAATVDPHFEILGTNATADDVTFNADGGILFTTDGADGDGIILLPHLDAGVSPWTEYTWGTDQSVRWACCIKTGADITNSIIWAGLKKTNTDVIATDTDQAFFRYENAINSGKWQAVSSIGDSDDAHDSGVTVAANTVYHLEVRISATRVATFYINGTLVETSAALTDAVDFIPYIAVEADGAAEAKTLLVYSQEISRNYA